MPEASKAVREHKQSAPREMRVAVITVSDTKDEATDESGRILRNGVEAAGHRLAHYAIVRDETNESTHLAVFRADRVIYMDGRPHPPEYAPHTWMGFSTGRWVGDMLEVRTTHIKSEWFRRNGIPNSDRTRLPFIPILSGDFVTVPHGLNENPRAIPVMVHDAVGTEVDPLRIGVANDH